MKAVVSGLVPVARRFLLAQFLYHLAEAERGNLTFAKSKKKGPVCSLGVTDHRVLELRFDDQVTAEGVRQATRFYFTEPDVEPDRLLGLHVDWKRPSEEGKSEQDLHAIEAATRMDAHYAAGSS
ncbi:hypothetical protein [Lapillicoccus jejuensis]|uniref:Uncharacterized protein n=1 Tax=Lapillicoccus jejuensis TaxID=402171 RepID=A0A542DW09_9MICO|nr:hypothetical protein [Lapillicoccus jejuensis]TQJ07236.1 hypothetical protein FB458_0294 [Lapillicoccus jejuensis]